MLQIYISHCLILWINIFYKFVLLVRYFNNVVIPQWIFTILRLTHTGLISLELDKCDLPTANNVTYKHRPGSILKSLLALASCMTSSVQFLCAYSPILAFKEVSSISSSPFFITAFLDFSSPILTLGKMSSPCGTDPTCHSGK